MAEVESFYSSRSDCPPAAGIWVFHAGKITGDGYSHYHWYPDYICFHILSRGHGTIKTPTEERDVQSGDMFTLWPNVDIEYYKDPSDPWFVHFIHLRGPYAVNFGRECGFDAEHCCIRPEHPLEVIRDFNTIFRLIKDGDRADSYSYEIQSALYQIIGHCRGVQKVKHKRSCASEELVKRAEMLIEAKLDTGININDLAAFMHVGRTTLFNAFRQVRSISPIEYLTRYRLERAKKLLLEQRYPIYKIAAMSGYKDIYYFYKCFQQREKMSVTAWLDRQFRLSNKKTQK